ncbi:MAG: dihydroorotate dehydrogenase electron transfer subunit [Candidatus Omnitrophota bacterium]|nr:dihydroorotate dehydrogenase electron transfer subunit [Candidatus Omnitrophota bacterium]
MKQLKAKIIENRKIAQGFYKMKLASGYLAKNSKPGQFVEIKCSEGSEILLRRPLGVHRIYDGGIEVLYEVIGKGTSHLSFREKGELLDIIGPIGKGFEFHGAKKPALIVAGGMGVAPLLCLAEKMAGNKMKPYVMIGAKTASHILCEKEFKRLGCFVMVSTEDGSIGHKGYVTDIMRHLLIVIRCKSSGIYACGPHPMLKAVAHIADSSGIPCQVSMEEHMACGVGVCFGCPVKIKSGGYKMVCKDGPIFNAKEIAW